MALPIVNFKHKNTESDEVLQDLFTHKLQSLEKYLGEETDQKIEVEFERMTTHQSGNIYRVEANVWLKGKLYRGEANKDSFEKAVDIVRDELDKEMRRANRKKENLFRQGARKVKGMMMREK